MVTIHPKWELRTIQPDPMSTGDGTTSLWRLIRVENIGGFLCMEFISFDYRSQLINDIHSVDDNDIHDLLEPRSGQTLQI